MPTCWIIAGPNGAGKTTFALEFLFNAFAAAVDKCECFLNTGSQPVPIFEQEGSRLRVIDTYWCQHLVKESGA